MPSNPLSISAALESLRKAASGGKTKKSVVETITHLSTSLVLLNSSSPSSQSIDKLITLFRAPFAPLYTTFPTQTLQLCASILHTVFKERILPRLDTPGGLPCMETSATDKGWEKALNALLSGVLDFFENDETDKIKLAIANSLYSPLSKFFFLSEGSTLGVNLRSTAYMLLSETAVLHAKNQTKLRDAKVLGAKKLGAVIAQTKDFLVLEGLLTLFARLLPSSTPSPAKRIAFIRDIFVVQQALPSGCGEAIAEVLEDVPAKDWEVTSAKIVDTLANSDSEFPQPFSVNEVTACGVIFPQPNRDDRLYLDRQAFLAKIAQSDEFYEPLQVFYETVQGITFSSAPHGTKTRVALDLTSQPLIADQPMKQSSFNGNTLVVNICNEDMPRFITVLRQRGLANLIPGKNSSRSAPRVSVTESSTKLDYGYSGTDKSELLSTSQKKVEEVQKFYNTQAPSDDTLVRDPNIKVLAEAPRQKQKTMTAPLTREDDFSAQVKEGLSDIAPPAPIPAPRAKGAAPALKPTASKLLRNTVFGASNEALSEIADEASMLHHTTKQRVSGEETKLPREFKSKGTKKKVDATITINSIMIKRKTKRTNDHQNHYDEQRPTDAPSLEPKDRTRKQPIALSDLEEESAPALATDRPDLFDEPPTDPTEAACLKKSVLPEASARALVKSLTEGNCAIPPDGTAASARAVKTPDLWDVTVATRGSVSKPQDITAVDDNAPSRRSKRKSAVVATSKLATLHDSTSSDIEAASSPASKKADTKGPINENQDLHRDELMLKSTCTAPMLPVTGTELLVTNNSGMRSNKRRILDADAEKCIIEPPLKKLNMDSKIIHHDVVLRSDSEVFKSRKTAAKRATYRYGYRGRKGRPSSPARAAADEIDWDEIPAELSSTEPIYEVEPIPGPPGAVGPAAALFLPLPCPPDAATGTKPTHITDPVVSALPQSVTSKAGVKRVPRHKVASARLKENNAPATKRSVPSPSTHEQASNPMSKARMPEAFSKIRLDGPLLKTPVVVSKQDCDRIQMEDTTMQPQNVAEKQVDDKHTIVPIDKGKIIHNRSAAGSLSIKPKKALWQAANFPIQNTDGSSKLTMDITNGPPPAAVQVIPDTDDGYEDLPVVDKSEFGIDFDQILHNRRQTHIEKHVEQNANIDMIDLTIDDNPPISDVAFPSETQPRSVNAIHNLGSSGQLAAKQLIVAIESPPRKAESHLTPARTDNDAERHGNSDTILNPEHRAGNVPPRRLAPLHEVGEKPSALHVPFSFDENAEDDEIVPASRKTNEVRLKSLAAQNVSLKDTQMKLSAKFVAQELRAKQIESREDSGLIERRQHAPGVEEIVEVLEAIQDVIVTRVANKSQAVRSDIRAARNELLREATEILYAMRQESVEHFNTLLSLEKEYANIGRQLATGYDGMGRVNKEVCEKIRRTITDHDRSTLSKKMPKTLFDAELPAAFRKFLT